MLDLRDKMDERISQLDALLVLLTENVDDPRGGGQMLLISQFSHDIQHRLMWLASSLANEIRDVNWQMADAEFSKVSHG